MKYEVVIKVNRIYYVEVSAENAESAEDKALARWEVNPDSFYVEDGDPECEVEEV